MLRRLTLLALLLTLVLAPTPARASIALGATGPEFTKSLLGGGSASLSQYSGKVVVIFLLGYNCPYCLSNGPSVQQNLWQYYRSIDSTQVQVIGVDLWNGSATQMNVFKQQTGTTYPLLLNGATATGGNVELLYGPFDNFVVMNKRGIVRYHAALNYAHGNRYHLDEIRGCVDSLITIGAGVEDGLPQRLSLAASPNPARGALHVDLALPRDAENVHVQVLDASGRRIATLFHGRAVAGAHRFEWSAADDRGIAAAPGVYLVVVEAGRDRLARRVVVIR